MGKNVSEFEDPQDETVLMVDSSGKKYYIPASEREEALKDGLIDG
jgi:hypothetical protein